MLEGGTAVWIWVLGPGRLPSLLVAKRTPALPSWLMLFEQVDCFALSWAFWTAGSSIAAKMAMMAMTTSSSMRVNFFMARISCCRDVMRY